MIGAALILMASGPVEQVSSVGTWKVTCVSEQASADGLFDYCTMKAKVDGLAIEVRRDGDGAQFWVKGGCKAKQPVDPSTRTTDQLSGENRINYFQGGVIEQVFLNCRAAQQRPRIVTINIPDTEAVLAATAQLRSKAN